MYSDHGIGNETPAAKTISLVSRMGEIANGSIHQALFKG